MMFYLMSVHDDYASLILSGEKRVEIRSNGVHMRPGDYVAIYATKPLGRIVGYFVVDSVIIDDQETIWDKYKDQACMLRENYLSYTKDKRTISAIVIKKSIKKDGLYLADIDIRIPQRYMKISKEQFLDICRIPSL